MAEPRKKKPKKRRAAAPPTGDDLLDRIAARQQGLGQRGPAFYGLGCGVGALVTPFALWLALASTGARHGNYRSAWFLYPFPMLLSGITGRIGAVAIFLALVQFPVYGLIVSYAASWGQRALWITAGTLAVLHIAAVLLPYLSAVLLPHLF